MQLEDALYADRATSVASTDLVQIYVPTAHPKGSKVITSGNLFGSAATAMTSTQLKALLTAAVATLPTSSAGLSAGDLWVNSGVVTVV